MPWDMQKVASEKVKDPILIEGLPGVGNVGKIAIEYLIEALDAKKVYDITSDELPHYVFINDENVVELPKIEMYTTKKRGRSILLLSGDLQPISESSCYTFCNKILDMLQKNKGKEIITLGGIGLNEEPEQPEVFYTGNSKKALQKYPKNKNKVNGFIGPIMGVTGLLSGLAGKRKINAVTLLAETYNHPQHIGIKGAKKLVEVINKKLNLNIDMLDFEEEFGLEKKGKKQKRVKKSKKEKEVQSEEIVKERLEYIG